MKKTQLRLAGLLLPAALILAAASPALGQLDARRRPRVSGPLELQVTRCKRRPVRVREGVAASARACIRFYRFTAENDPARDYGAIWLQVNVNARRRWCVATILADIPLPDGARMHARAPRSRRAARRRSVRTRLVVDAAGHARRRVGVIRRRYDLLAGRLRTRSLAGDVWRARWRGSSRRLFAVATGVEISWAEAREAPGRVSSRLRYEIHYRRRC
jgi:hypothetical protein